jgi:Ca-activated chloride channel homolog
MAEKTASFRQTAMRALIYIAAVLLPCALTAQQERYILREGNNQYHNGRYKEAEQHYSEALKKKNGYFKANYNLGNAMYKQGKYQDATGQFDVFIKNSSDKDTLSRAFHNLGNSYLKQKKYEDAIKAYKSSLKLNPKDEDTRYNLAFAKKKLEEQQKKGGGQDKKENKEQQQKNQQNKDSKDQKEQKDKKDEPQMSKEEAQRMLEALKNQEQKLQELHRKKGDKKGVPKKVDKDW